MIHTEQIARIRAKLDSAQKADRGRQVFGAGSHKYFVASPAKEKKVAAFEQKHGISLPACYRSFLTQVGNGGKSYSKSAAGPFYGIYPLGEGVDDLVENSNTFLNQDTMIYPGISEDAWAEMIRRLDDYNLSDEDHDAEMAKLYAGVLPIGSQGCSYLHGIVVTGKYRGRVVNLDQDLQRPHFAFEDNFLDWYERWLDEVISGELMVDGPSFFGYSMGGTDQELVAKYLSATEAEYRSDVLSGLATKSHVGPEAIELFERECANEDPHLAKMCRQLLTKHDYSRAKPVLKQTYETNPLHAFQCVHWFAEQFSEDWVAEIKEVLSGGSIEPKLFDFATYLLSACRTDLTHLLEPFAEHEDNHLRDQARYILAEVKSARTN